MLTSQRPSTVVIRPTLPLLIIATPMRRASGLLNPASRAPRPTAKDLADNRSEDNHVGDGYPAGFQRPCAPSCTCFITLSFLRCCVWLTRGNYLT